MMVTTNDDLDMSKAAGVLERIRSHQKRQDITEVFFHRKLSPFVSAVCLRLGMSANTITAVWGGLNVLGSAFVFLALTRHVAFVLLVPLVHNFSEVLDCSDGEVARVTGSASPIGGKLLDGVSHKATEFSLQTAFVLAAWWLAPAWYVPCLAAALLAGEGMLGYTYERRLLILRVHAAFTGRATTMMPDDLYEPGERWWGFSVRKKIKTLRGFIHYKSVYFLVALAQLSTVALLFGLGAMAVYKHYTWIRLAAETVRTAPVTPTGGAS
jgi:phosphatidylglycerophosphate synthase